MTRVALYSRISRDPQQDSEASQDDQGARILAYLEARGWVNVAEYVDDTQGDPE